MTNQTIIKFQDVSFDFGPTKPILEEVTFSIKEHTKIALMGQNGAGKSTIFKILTGTLQPTSGTISVDMNLKIATAHQIMSHADLDLSTEEYFQKSTGLSDHELKRAIAQALEVVNLVAPLDKVIRKYSGGQQARLLLAAALAQNPDILLLDEPTNNLDKTGIEHLTEFLTYYPFTCLVISHDTQFLNAFTDGVLYLDNFLHTIEHYSGNYFDVIEQIALRKERENRLNARMQKGILERKEKANFFAHKGGKMRLVAKKMRDQAEEMESQKVDLRKDDKTIRPFSIPTQETLATVIMRLNSYTLIHDHKPITKQESIVLTKKQHMLISGPNGIGKSTLIESIANATAHDIQIAPNTRIGYYRQDFTTLNFEDTVYGSFLKILEDSNGSMHEQDIRSLSAGFLLNSHILETQIGHLSEGQKGLVAFAQLILMKPGLLILDEPTNHINFRHIPVIAKALDTFEGAMILVSHVPEFVAQIRIDKELVLAP